MGLRVAVLGPVRVAVDGDELRPVALGRRERAILTLLALNPGRLVSASRLVDELWPEGAPDGAANTVQTYISRIRRVVGREFVRRDASGYVLDVSPRDVDAIEFERMAGEARHALGAGQLADCSALAGRAAALWDGPALADGLALPSLAADAVRLEELRLAALEDAVEADVGLGDGPRRIADLTQCVGQHPFRERLQAALITALCQDGRQADALEVYAGYRQLCVDELGMEPSPALQSLQSQVLAGGDGLPARAPTAAVPDLPTGTVSMLFCDVEGSTALLARLGPTYADVLEVQRSVLRKAWSDHDGREMGTEGDSFFVVFRMAGDAVRAALQAQRDLAAQEWPGAAQVRVRIGIHTGEPLRHAGGYVGMDVHRAARVASAAHGSQIVLTSATWELVAGSPPDDTTIRDLGWHRLKDIPAPLHLWQLSTDGLADAFPPPRSLGTTSSLPAEPTPLVGRETDIASLSALLDHGARLVTLTGTGGSGKTRLAVALAKARADSTPDGVFFVPLAAASTGADIWPAAARALSADGQGDPRQRLTAQMAGRAPLLVLDNLEQIPDAGPVVHDVLEVLPRATVVATSRRALHVVGEHQHAVRPLSLPLEDALAAVTASPAVALFCQHAQMVRPAFEIDAGNAADVAALCRRLDGLPLALELAAASLKLLSPGALLSRLSTAADLRDPAAGRPERQNTLRDTIGWSYRLLSDDLQRMFCRLGVFVGGASLDAVAAVALDHPGDPLDSVAALVDANLAGIVEDADGQPRVTMLQTVIAYALEELERQGTLEQTRQLHARHYAALAEDLAGGIYRGRHNQTRDRFLIEVDNFRAALAWSLQPGDGGGSQGYRTHLGLRLCAALTHFWEFYGDLQEAQSWYARALEVDAGDDSREGAIVLWATVGSRAYGERGDPSDYSRLEASLAVARRLDLPDVEALALAWLAWYDISHGRPEAAQGKAEAAADCARRSRDPLALTYALAVRADMLSNSGRHDEAIATCEELQRLARERGDEGAYAYGEDWIAKILLRAGRAAEALTRLQAMSALLLQVANQAVERNVLGSFADAHAALGMYEHAAVMFGARWSLGTRMGHADLEESDSTDETVIRARQALGEDDWSRAVQHGRSLSVEAAVRYAATAPISPALSAGGTNSKQVSDAAGPR